MIAIGIDIGTTTIGCVLADCASGTILKTLTRANDSGIVSARPGEAIQDPERIMTRVRELLAECGKVRIGAIGISCQMHGMLYVDASGKHVSPLYTWQDKSGEEGFDSGRTYVAYLEELTGWQLSSGYGLVTHFCHLHKKKAPRNAAAICTIGDYAAMRLTGATSPVIDPTNAAGFGMFVPDRMEFDRVAMERAGIDASIVPEVAGRAAGKTALAGMTPHGQPVFCAIGDNQASFLGAVPSLSGTLQVNIGTGAQVSVYSEQFEAGPGLETRPFPGGGYLLVGASLAGGKSYALLEQFFRETCRVFSGYQGDSLYSEMNRLAEEALKEAPEAPRVETQFYGTRQNPGAAGTIAGLLPWNFTPRHLILGVLQGITDELLGFVDDFPHELGSRLRIACGSGNGLRKNSALQKLLQQKLKLPLILPEVEEEAAYGAAIYAAVGAGFFPDLETAIRIMSRTRYGNEG